MPKSSRDIRAMARTLNQQREELLKLRREHLQTTQDAIAFKKMAFAAKRKYDRELSNAKQEANILRQSLKNFSGPYYEQRKALRKQAKMLKAYRAAKKSRRRSSKRSIYV